MVSNLDGMVACDRCASLGEYPHFSEKQCRQCICGDYKVFLCATCIAVFDAETNEYARTLCCSCQYDEDEI